MFVVVYQDLLQLLLLTLVRFLRPSLSGVLQKHSNMTLDEMVWHQSADLRSQKVVPLCLFLSADESPFRKSDSLFHFINEAHLLFVSYQPTPGTEGCSSVLSLDKAWVSFLFVFYFKIKKR